MEENDKIRTVIFYKEYFKEFFVNQREKVQNKIIWTLDLIAEIEKIPESYFKLMEGTDGLYEVRVK